MKKWVGFYMVCLILILVVGCTTEEKTFESEPIEITQLEIETDESQESQGGENSDDQDSVESSEQENDHEETNTEETNTEESNIVEANINEPIIYKMDSALNKEDGTVLVKMDAYQNDNVIWSKTWPKSQLSQLDPYSQVTEYKNSVYIEVHANLYGLDKLTGKELFQPVRTGVTSKPIVDEGGFIYCEGYFGPYFLTKLSPEGQVLWTKDPPLHAIWPLKVEVDQDNVYVHYQNSENTDYNLIQYQKTDGKAKLSYWLEENEVFFSNVSASSTLDGYPTQNLLDGLLETGWSEGESDYGIGQTLMFESDQNKALSKIIIENGYQKSEDLFYANGRVKKIRVTLSNDKSYVFDLHNNMGNNVLTFDEMQSANKVEIEILEIYPAEKYTDTVISSVSFFK